MASTITPSKRMLNNIESNQQVSLPKKGWSINNKYEVIILGDAYIGKTSYLNALFLSAKDTNFPVMASGDRSEYEFWIEHKEMKAIFKIRDTANQERFRSLTQTYYRKAECVLLFFDINSPESFDNLHQWHTDIFTYCKKPDKNFAIVLVGLKRNNRTKNAAYSEYTLQELIDKFQNEHSYIIDYCEVDLETNMNLKEPFELLLENFSNSSRLLPTSYFEKQIVSSLRRSTLNIRNSSKLNDDRSCKCQI